MKKVLVLIVILIMQLITVSDSFAQIPGGIDGVKLPALDASSYAAVVKGEVVIFLVQKTSLTDVLVSSFSPNKIANSLAANIVKLGNKVSLSGFFGKTEASVASVNGKLNIVITSNNSSGGLDYFSWGVSQ